MDRACSRSARRSGHTLLELTLYLLIVSLLLGLVWPVARGARDRYAVMAARDAFAGALARARAAAIAAGGAELTLAVREGTVWLETPGAVGAASLIRLEEYGVTVDAGSAADTVRIGYDGLGLGRVASRTLRFRRGAAEAGVTIASYGRVRRW